MTTVSVSKFVSPSSVANLQMYSITLQPRVKLTPAYLLTKILVTKATEKDIQLQGREIFELLQRNILQKSLTVDVGSLKFSDMGCNPPPHGNAGQVARSSVGNVEVSSDNVSWLGC